MTRIEYDIWLDWFKLVLPAVASSGTRMIPDEVVGVASRIADAAMKLCAERVEGIRAAQLDKQFKGQLE